jgi:hypothetical protein
MCSVASGSPSRLPPSRSQATPSRRRQEPPLRAHSPCCRRRKPYHGGRRWREISSPKIQSPPKNFAPKLTRSRLLLCIGAPWARGRPSRRSGRPSALWRDRHQALLLLPLERAILLLPMWPGHRPLSRPALVFVARGGVARLGMHGSPSPAICDAARLPARSYPASASSLLRHARFGFVAPLPCCR